MLLNFREKVNIWDKRLGTDIKDEKQENLFRGLTHLMIMGEGVIKMKNFKYFLKVFFVPHSPFSCCLYHTCVTFWLHSCC